MVFRNMVAAFKCYPVTVYELVFPPAFIHVDETTTWLDHEEVKDPSNYSFIVNRTNQLSKVGLSCY